MTAAPDIFLSYNREDQARAKLFAEAFEAQGFKVWWDTTLRAGEAYDEVTETALRTAKAVVVLWSKKSVVSRWVRAEATLADRNKTLVPCMIEACERPIMFELTQTADLSHWQGDAADKAWTAFLADVRLFVGKAVPLEAPTPIAAPLTVEESLKPGQSGSAPSLAVLPFTNRSGLADDDIFAEGMVEDLISALSQGVNVRVLGASSTASLSRAMIADIPALGRQLGVRYLLEGNVRRVGANLRVTTQLLEAATGEVMWTAKFDRPLAELAELQEELVVEVAGRLDTQVYTLETERALKKPGDITAWEAMARATAAYRTRSLVALELAITESRKAVAIAPDYGPAHARLASALSVAYSAKGIEDPTMLSEISRSVERGLALSPDDAFVLAYIGYALGNIGQAAEGLTYTARALRMAPGTGMIHNQHAQLCLRLGQTEVGLARLEIAIRLMQGSPVMGVMKSFKAMACRELGRLHDAQVAIDEAVMLNPESGQYHCDKALIYLLLGDDATARQSIATARSLQSSFAACVRALRVRMPKSPTLETDIAAIKALFAETDQTA